MKFPGKRKIKHYFPVSERGRISFEFEFSENNVSYILGIDQVLVDIEAHIPDSFLADWNLQKGQSTILPESVAGELHHQLEIQDLIKGEFAGGTIGNTLHNYSILSESESVLLGTIKQDIMVGDYAFKYLRNTAPLVNLSHLTPVGGEMGRAFCLVTPDGERTFALSPGEMNQLPSSSIDSDLLSKAGLFLITAYLLRDENDPIYEATIKACKMAKEHNVPIVLTLGADGLVREKKEFFNQFIKEYVSILAMNGEEAHALTGESDPINAMGGILELADFSLLTIGKDGLLVGGFCDKEYLRETKNELRAHLNYPAFNSYEFSRSMLKKDCLDPVQIISHINPFMGGPGEQIKNTNGAGDAALSALLHDIMANTFHRQTLPSSPKHRANFLTYSSLAQISKYCNRVSYEVLKQNSPRLIRGLPDREDCLEEEYWER